MTRLLDRIAARFGFERVRPPMTELVIFHDAQRARFKGFKGTRHWKHDHITCWWPGLGMAGLSGPPPQRVTISEDMHRCIVQGEGRLVDILFKRQQVFGDDYLWVEL